MAGLVIQDGKVLMMQEAKQSCRGTWYLPAGRMEENETIVVSVRLCLHHAWCMYMCACAKFVLVTVVLVM